MEVGCIDPFDQSIDARGQAVSSNINIEHFPEIKLKGKIEAFTKIS
jgi:hypothetical protein